MCIRDRVYSRKGRRGQNMKSKPRSRGSSGHTAKGAELAAKHRDKKVQVAKKNLMEALFEGEGCSLCRKPLSYSADKFRNTCGHVFHAMCVSNIGKCSCCGKRIDNICAN
eukprot:TRINITY_DN8364_c0_g1_i11.p1 TRINITY_DN8364_c0_g1~~TRINITY_DN8364_c0_g1_i11.p1  ORF type:complete len:121 (+),score=24.09 TRINITY_DN8364_c0_g1_i11:35-364(+)